MDLSNVATACAWTRTQSGRTVRSDARVGENPRELVSKELADELPSAGAFLVGQDHLLAGTATRDAIDQVSRDAACGHPGDGFTLGDQDAVCDSGASARAQTVRPRST